MLKLNHKNLDVWKVAMACVKHIYALTEKFPPSESYGLINQLRRAAVSVPSNIAEGSARSKVADRRRFFEIARSSLAEIDTQMEISIMLNYCNEKDLKDLSKDMNSLFGLLSKLIQNTS